MAVDNRASSSETRPLLDEVQISYSSTISSDTSTLAESEESLDPIPLNNFSRVDTCWILAGLWSAVFLGALDGELEYDVKRGTLTSAARNCGGYLASTHWKRFQQITPVIIYRYLLSTIIVLLYTTLWYADASFMCC